MKFSRFYALLFTCLAVGCFILPTISVGQQPSYTVIGEDELNGVNVYSLLQDKQGKYWIATDQGLFQYDGYRFYTIPLVGANSRSLFDLKTDYHGVIHCKNLSGQFFRIENDTCRLFLEVEPSILKADMRYAFDDGNHLVLASNNIFKLNDRGNFELIDKGYEGGFFSEFYLHRDSSITCFNSTRDELVSIKGGVLSTEKVEVDKKGRLIVQYRLNDTTLFVDATDGTRFIKKSDSLVNAGRINGIDDDDLVRSHVGSNKIWYEFHSGGAYITNDQHELLYEGKMAFKNSILSAFLEDNDGNILLGTFGEGLFYVSPHAITTYPLPHFQERPNRVALNQDGEVYVGSQKGRVYKISKQGNFSVEVEGLGKNVEVLHYFESANLLLFDGREPVFKYLNSGYTADYVAGSIKNIKPVDGNRFLLSTNNGVIDVEIPKTWQNSTSYKTIEKTRSYCAYLDTLSNLYYIGTSQGLKKGSSDSKDFFQLEGEDMQASDIDRAGDNILVATQENGVLLFSNGELGGVWNKQSGLISNSIKKIQVGEDRIYLATSEGIQIVDFDGKSIAVVGKSEGLAAGNIIDFDISQGILWVVHQKGLQRVELNSIPKFEFVPDLQVSQRIDSEQKGAFNTVVTKAQFELRSFNLKYRDEIHFEYRLSGFDENWQKTSQERNTVTYQALAPGEYVFEARAVCRENKSQTQQIEFKVQKPFWEELWFLGLIIFFALLVIIIIYTIQIKKHRKKIKLQNELNASKLIAIQSQMNPHFIFNAINSIQDLILKGDIDNSYSYIIKFSQLVRKTLDFSNKEFIDMEEEIELLKIYLDLESLRFDKDFNYSISTKECEDVMVPPMLVQPLVENAIKHGLLHKKGQKNLRIAFMLKGQLVCEVEDNGIGRKASMEIKQRQSKGHKSFSIGAIKNRFEIMKTQYTQNIGVEYKDLEEDGQSTGTLVKIIMPYKPKY